MQKIVSARSSRPDTCSWQVLELRAHGSQMRQAYLETTATMLARVISQSCGDGPHWSLRMCNHRTLEYMNILFGCSYSRTQMYVKISMQHTYMHMHIYSYTFVLHTHTHTYSYTKGFTQKPIPFILGNMFARDVGERMRGVFCCSNGMQNQTLANCQ